MKKLIMLMGMTISLFSQTTSHSATLSWVDGVNPSGTTYNVYRAGGTCVGTPTFTKITTTPLTVLTYVDTNVTSNTNYCYTVKATLNGIESSNSNLISAAIPLDVYAPTKLTATVK